MPEVTLFLNKENYRLDSQLLIKHSRFLKDLLDMYPNKSEIYLPFPIKSLNKFVNYMNGNSNIDSLDYGEFTIHLYLDTKTYFDHLIYLMVMEGSDHEKIKSLNDDLAWEIYDHLPLNLIPEEMLKDMFIERYRTKTLPKYPEKILITRNKEEIKTEILISGKYYRDGRYLSWYPNGQLKEQSNWSKATEYISSKDGETNWLNRNLHANGLFESWYENGQRREISNWLDGRRNGLFESWYENGQRREISNWLDWTRNGLRETWYENGYREEITDWLDGKENGLHQSWYSNGQMEEMSNWLEGQEHGLCQTWHPDGHMVEESNWLRGKRE